MVISRRCHGPSDRWIDSGPVYGEVLTGETPRVLDPAPVQVIALEAKRSVRHATQCSLAQRARYFNSCTRRCGCSMRENKQSLALLPSDPFFAIIARLKPMFDRICWAMTRDRPRWPIVSQRCRRRTRYHPP